MSGRRHILLALVTVPFVGGCTPLPSATLSDSPRVEAEPEPEPTCPSRVAAPRPVLDGRLEIALPEGLDPAAIREWPEALDAGPAPLPCADGRTLVRLSLTTLPENRDYAMIDFRDLALSVLGYPYGMQIQTLVNDERNRELVEIIDVSTDASATAIGNRVYLRVFKLGFDIYVLVLEAAPEDFEGLRPTFEAVAASAGAVRG